MKDIEFIRHENVPMSKEEIRAISLNKLQLYDAKSLLDIGAGSGSVSIEACVHYPNLEAVAIEVKDVACHLIEKNKEKFNVSQYTVINDLAPTVISKKIDRIFVGGSNNGLEEILKWSYERLNENGIIVCNFIITENMVKANKIMKKIGFIDIELIQVSVNKSQKLGQYEFFKPINPVYIIKAEKRS